MASSSLSETLSSADRRSLRRHCCGQRGQFAGEFLRGRARLAMRHHPADQADLQCLGGGHAGGR